MRTHVPQKTTHAEHHCTVIRFTCNAPHVSLNDRMKLKISLAEQTGKIKGQFSQIFSGPEWAGFQKAVPIGGGTQIGTASIETMRISGNQAGAFPQSIEGKSAGHDLFSI